MLLELRSHYVNASDSMQRIVFHDEFSIILDQLQTNADELDNAVAAETVEWTERN